MDAFIHTYTHTHMHIYIQNCPLHGPSVHDEGVDSSLDDGETTSTSTEDEEVWVCVATVHKCMTASYTYI
jgi:hypothetical protein